MKFHKVFSKRSYSIYFASLLFLVPNTQVIVRIELIIMKEYNEIQARGKIEELYIGKSCHVLVL